MKLSVISPVYNAAAILPELVNQIRQVCDAKYDFEIILIDDSSTDNSWDVICDLARNTSVVKGYRLSRNFGQHFAITAGIEKASGDLLVIMDCDLQDNPEYIKDLVSKQKEGFEIVCTIKDEKKYSLFRKLSSNLFFMIVNRLSNVKIEKNLGTFTLISRKFADEFLGLKDYHRHTSLMFSWMGYKRGLVQVKQNPRYHGKSTYTLAKLVRHAINGVISQSDLILKGSITFGILMFLLSLIGTAYIVFKSFYTNYYIGWPSLFVLVLFSTGVILLSLGILGLYVGKIFEQVKNRPLYLISQSTQKDEQ
ncbi:MAG: glycosyltransferase family 2 protein [Bacteroidota bacterium]|nr:glycosyltransferase family 2 protein [Bacteroidota bacterium]